MLIIQVICVFMRFSNDAKFKYLIVENSRTSQQLVKAMQERTRIVKNIIDNEIPSVESTKHFAACVKYSDLQTPEKQVIHVKGAFPNLLQQPADVFFGIKNAKMDKVDTNSETDVQVGNSFGTTMTVFEDSKEGLVVNVKTTNLSAYSNEICYLTKSTTQRNRRLTDVTAAKSAQKPTRRIRRAAANNIKKRGRRFA